MRHGQAWFALVLGRTLLMRGAITDAHRYFLESAASFAWLHSDGPRRWALAGVVLSAVMSGDREQATAAKRELDAVPDHPARMMGIEVEHAGAWMRLLEPGGRARAIDELTNIARAGIDAGVVALAAGAAHDVIRLGGTIDDAALWDRIATVEGTLGAARVEMGRAASARTAVAATRAATSFAEMGAELFAAEAWELVAGLHDADGATRAATGAPCGGRRRPATSWRRLGCDARARAELPTPRADGTRTRGRRTRRGRADQPTDRRGVVRVDPHGREPSPARLRPPRHHGAA